MGMGMGAGFGFMMPSMIQQAMQAKGQGGQAQPAAGQAAAPAAAGAGAGLASATAGGVNFDLDQLQSAKSNPQDVVKQVVTSAGWQLSETPEGWQVVVPVGSLRQQKVLVRFADTDAEGNALVAFSSICGPASDKNAMALLRYNTRMVHGAFAVKETDAGDMIIVQANELADSLDAMVATRALTAVAWQADKVEEKLLGGDEY